MIGCGDLYMTHILKARRALLLVVDFGKPENPGHTELHASTVLLDPEYHDDAHGNCRSTNNA
jgi:hypothetical protein